MNRNRRRALLLLVSVGWIMFCIILSEFQSSIWKRGGASVAGLLHMLVMAMPIAMLWAAHFILTPMARLDGDVAPAGWVNVPAQEAERHRLYGVRGILASLVAGLLLTSAVRVATFVLVLPPVPDVVPDWYLFLCKLMFAETVAIGALYALCVAAALHHRGDFPALLMATWLVDLGAGFALSSLAGMVDGFPSGVARLLDILAEGNSWRILLSATIWIPYLFLSRRANVTFRGHLRSDDPLLGEAESDLKASR